MVKTAKKVIKIANSHKVAENVYSLLRPVVEPLGYELADVEYKMEDGNNVLTIFIYNENGISLDDCELVNNAIDPVLDEADPIEDSYYLSVSSLGLDRPLKKPRDFERMMGNMVTVSLFAQLNGKKTYVGVIKAADNGGFVIETDTGDMRFDYKSVGSVKPYIEF